MSNHHPRHDGSAPRQTALRECAALVRAESLDAWLATLLAPSPVQPPLLAGWAVALEVARLPWRLHEPLLARLRGEWWRETLLALADEIGRRGTEKSEEKEQGSREASAASAAERHNVATQGRAMDTRPAAEVSSTAVPDAPPLLLLRRAGMMSADASRATRAAIADLAEAVAHLSLLADTTLADADQARDFGQRTFMPLLRALLVIADAPQAEVFLQEPRHAAALHALATAFGIAFLLRRLPHARRTTPAPLLHTDAVPVLMKEARQAFGKARTARWPRPLLPALWPASLHMRWLRQAQDATGFPETPLPAPSQLRRQLHLLGLRLRGTL